MSKKIDIQVLADLARLNISGEESSELEKEISNILEFVREIQSVETLEQGRHVACRNVVREDSNPHESGIHTEVLMGAAPDVEKGRVKVRQVIKKDRRK